MTLSVIDILLLFSLGLMVAVLVSAAFQIGKILGNLIWVSMMMFIRRRREDESVQG